MGAGEGAATEAGLTRVGEAESATRPPESGCSVTPTRVWPVRGHGPGVPAVRPVHPHRVYACGWPVLGHSVCI